MAERVNILALWWKRVERKMNRVVVWAFIVSVCLLPTVFWPFFLIRVEASSNTIYVDARNVNDPGEDGSAVHPFDSIEKGVGAAGSGDTVQVASGVYYESVQIVESSISLVGQKGNTIIDGNGTGLVGIRVFQIPPSYAENVSISGFTVRNWVRGITLSRSSNIRLRDVTMVNNTYDFGDYSLQAQDIDTSNTVDGKPVYYWVNQRDKQVPADAGFVALVDSSNITVRDLNLTNNVQGIVLKNTTSSLVENVRILNNWDGMYLDRWSTNDTVTDSIMSNNLFMGIYVSISSGNTIANNSISNNAYGLLFDSTAYEAVIGYNATRDTVRDNVIMGNTVANNSLVGVYLIGTEGNIFYHNNFANNTQQVYTSTNSTDKWDNGAEGNYWSNYSGEDSDKDGFGDSPYMIDGNNVDNHPLMGLFSDFPVVWQEETYPVTTISNSTILDFYFSQPDKTVGFNVSGPDEGTGFCRVSLPVSLLGGPYVLVLDGVPSTNLQETSNGTNSFLYFTYNNSCHDVKIEGTSVVPEFPLFSFAFFSAALIVEVTIVVWTRRKNAPAG
jgi:parallel beta-helix repeat protein